MEIRQCVFVILFILSSCCLLEINGSQGDILGRLYATMSRANSTIDIGDFKTSFLNEIHNTHKYKIFSQEGMKEKDIIKILPGQPPVEFAQYGGYVTIDESAGRALYYYFVEAPNSKETLPLLLWFNGGPGCSSLGYGAMEELGPFRVSSDGKTLYRNRFSWNSVANVLFLEAPVGVGFSYSNTTSEDYGDQRTAEDNYVFMLNWLERFPEYKTRDFYIAGESYGGHYVPQLAQTILSHNKLGNNTTINLKGIIIGNPAINYEADMLGMFDFLANHAVISDQTSNNVRNYCDFSRQNTTPSPECNAAGAEVNENLENLDMYNIYASLCHDPNLTENPKNASDTELDPCSDNYVLAYLNTPEVQQAMHANVTNLQYQWNGCSNVSKYWKDTPLSILPILKDLMANRLKVWVYSGDVDARVPFTSTIYSINRMNLTVKDAWHSWYLDVEIGGYTQVYDGDLTFVTVREAGHTVPASQPTRALSLIKHFLNGTPLPGKSVVRKA